MHATTLVMQHFTRRAHIVRTNLHATPDHDRSLVGGMLFLAAVLPVVCRVQVICRQEPTQVL